MFTFALLAGAMSLACGHDVPAQASPQGVALIGVAAISADASDLSGLTEPIAGTEFRQDRVGSMGSGLEYTGNGNTYYALCDRGPSDGAVAYVPRFQTLTIAVDVKAMSVSVKLESTTLFSDEQGRRYTGLAASFDEKAPAQGRRLDTEGIRVARNGNVFTSDEYGPWIDEWTVRGVHVRRIEVPAKFRVAKLGATPAEEFPPHNASGRQSNRGMEGLARSLDGKFLYGVVQSPLIQDGGLDEKNKRAGTNVRVLELELESGKTREFLYPLEDSKTGVNELVAAGPRTLLALERDGAEGAKAEFKRVYKVELDGASDVSAVDKLPAKGIPAGVAPLKKSLLVDFLDPRFGLAGEKMPEKLEGLAFGPDLADGRRLLIVSIDNDFRAEVPSSFWAFAIDPALLPGYRPAVIEAR